MSPLSTRWSTTIVDSLRSLDDAELDRVTVAAPPFFDRRWLRLLDTLDLPLLVSGEIALRYVLTYRLGELVALCPFIVTRSPTIYYHYSLEKFFFTAWREELTRMNPGSRRWSPWAFAAVDAYRRFARAARTGIEGWVLAVSPLSYRGDIALAPCDEDDARGAREQVLEALKGVARSERLPLCFYGVGHERADLRSALAASRFEEIFFVYDNRIDTDVRSFEEYLDRFPSKQRRSVRSEGRATARSGVTFHVTTDFGGMQEELASLYHATYSKYGDEHFRHPPSFWSAFGQHLPPMAEAIVARRDDRIVGFTALLGKGEDLWAYRLGRADGGEGEPFVYFSLAYYEPIKRAIARGAKRLWLAAGTWEAKRRRGAVGHAFYSYLWFPTRRSKLLLLPYLKLFSDLSRAQMTAAVNVASAEDVTEPQVVNPRSR